MRRENLGTRLPQRLHNFNAAAGGGDQVLHHDHLLAFFQLALNAVLTAVVLVAAAHVAHGRCIMCATMAAWAMPAVDVP